MPVSQNIVLEGFRYGIGEADLPEVGPNGLPTGRGVRRKVLLLEHPGIRVEVRFSEGDWGEFVRQASGRRVVPASPADVARLNGG